MAYPNTDGYLQVDPAVEIEMRLRRRKNCGQPSTGP